MDVSTKMLAPRVLGHEFFSMMWLCLAVTPMVSSLNHDFWDSSLMLDVYLSFVFSWISSIPFANSFYWFSLLILTCLYLVRAWLVGLERCSEVEGISASSLRTAGHVVAKSRSICRSIFLPQGGIANLMARGRDILSFYWKGVGNNIQPIKITFITVATCLYFFLFTNW